MKKVLVGSFTALTALACLRPMQERAERDREVGKESADGTEIAVDNGLAAVFDLAEDAAVLWSSAPAISGHLTTARATSFAFEARNLVPGAELVVTTSDRAPLAVALTGEPLPTRRRWQVSLPASTTVTWTLAPPGARERAPFSFGVLSDVQEALDRVGDFYDVMNADPELHFVLGAGDLTEQGTEGQLREFQRRLEALRVPYYATLGNHELGTTPVLWHDFFGRASHHFTYHGVHYSMIDSGSASIDPIVYGWLDGWLADARQAVHIVAMHIPPVDPFGLRNGSFGSRKEAAKLLARLAAGGVDLTLYGHIHSHYSFDNAGIPAHISGGGGAIPERFDGIGRHYLTVDVDPEHGVTGVDVVRID